MRILFFLGWPIPFPGAAWTGVSFYAAYFMRKGHKVDVAGTFSPRSLRKAGAAYWKGIRIYNLCPTVESSGVFPLISSVFLSIISLVPLLLILQPESVVISVPRGEPALGAYLASRLVGAKVVIDYRDEWEDFAISLAKSRVSRRVSMCFKDLMSRIYNRSDLVIAVTQAFARSLSLRGISGIKVVSNGADITIFKPYDKELVRERLGLRKEDFVIVYEGSSGGYYRLDIVVKSLARMVHEDANPKFIIVGSQPGVDGILKLARSVGLDKNVLYLGAKDDKKELAEILSSADVGVVPYDDNPFWRNTYPVKFFEYCACGLPVVATTFEDSILSDLITENNLGIVVPPLDDSRLSEAIMRFYEDISFREVAGKRARLLAEEMFDRNKTAKVFHESIIRMMEAKR